MERRMKIVLPIVACLLIMIVSFGYGQSTLPDQRGASTQTIPFSKSGTTATVPQKISYQGLLTNSSGAPVADGAYDLKFEMFNVSTSGGALWSETQTGVTVSHGTFSVLLGSVTPLPGIFYQPLWLEVTALTGPGISGSITFSPRNELASAAYSMGPWISNGDTLYLPSVKHVGINTASPKVALDVSDYDSPTMARFSPSGMMPLNIIANSPQIGFNIGYSNYAFRYDNSNSGGTFDFNQNILGGFTINTAPSGIAGEIATLAPRLAITNDGLVGIGTIEPQFRFHVAGNAKIDSTLRIGDSTSSGEIKMYQNGSLAPTLQAYDFYGRGAALDYYDEEGHYIGGFEPDYDGTGGYFSVYRAPYESGFQVNGNWSGLNEPYVAVQGSARSAQFNMYYTANASVVLPDSSISSVEILDEPGIARGKNTSRVTVPTTGIANLTSATITVPGPGYIKALGTGTVELIGDTIGNVRMGIETTSTSSLTFGEYTFFGSTNEPIGLSIYRWGSLAVDRVFYVSDAGTYSYYLNADRGYDADAGYVWYSKLTLVYYPTSYGTVSASLPESEALNISSASSELGENAGGRGNRTESTTYTVDLRDLEIKAATARAKAEKAERELMEAKVNLQNGPQR
jgi:hypothetical protein